MYLFVPQLLSNALTVLGVEDDDLQGDDSKVDGIDPQPHVVRDGGTVRTGIG